MSRLFFALVAVLLQASGCVGPARYYSRTLSELAWSENGSEIYFIYGAAGIGTNIYRVASAGGKPESIDELYALGVSFQQMDIRGNDMFLRGHHFRHDDSLSGRKPPLPGGEDVPLFGRPEHYVYHLDIKKAERIELPEAIADPFAWSNDGGILYISKPEGEGQGTRYRILEYDRKTGQSREIMSNVDPYRLSLSPDRRKLAFVGSRRKGLSFAGGAVVSVSATEKFQASYSDDNILGWLDNDAILVEISDPAGSYRRDLKTGQASPFSIQGKDEGIGFVIPHLPTGRLAVIGALRIMTTELDGSNPKILVDAHEQLPKGEMLYAY